MTGCASGAVHQAKETRRVDAVSHADRPHGVPSPHGGHAVVRVATQYLGTAYVWGGASPSGFDCSGFVRYIYAKLGVPLPRTVRDQYAIGTAVSRNGLRAGDIVFFDRLRHNGVYIGDGRLIHASSTGSAVRIAKLDDEWFKQRWVGARRPQSSATWVPPTPSVTTPAQRRDVASAPSGP